MSGMKTRRNRKAVRENLDLVQQARRFEVNNRSDGKSPRTVQWYNRTVEVFTGWLESEGTSTRLDGLGEDVARLFILHLQERGGLWGKGSSHTVNNRVRALSLLQLAVPPGLHRDPPAGAGEAPQGETERNRDSHGPGD